MPGAEATSAWPARNTDGLRIPEEEELQMTKLTASSLLILLLGVAHAGLTPLDAVYRLWDRPALTRVVEEYEAFLRGKPNSPPGMKVLGIAYHNLGVLKVSGAVAKAVATLTQAQKLLPGDPEVLAYLGSAR